MESQKREKINKFLSDKMMSGYVWEVVLASFLRQRKDADVQLKAAQMIAIELLHEAWKELERDRTSQEVEKKELKQVGL